MYKNESVEAQKVKFFFDCEPQGSSGGECPAVNRTFLIKFRNVSREVSRTVGF